MPNIKNKIKINYFSCLNYKILIISEIYRLRNI